MLQNCYCDLHVLVPGGSHGSSCVGSPENESLWGHILEHVANSYLARCLQNVIHHTKSYTVKKKFVSNHSKITSNTGFDRGGLTLWPLGNALGPTTLGGPLSLCKPIHKWSILPQKLLLPKGPRGSQYAPGFFLLLLF